MDLNEIDGFTEADDESTLDYYSRNGTCMECGDADTGFCFCTVASDEAERLGMSKKATIRRFRIDTEEGMRELKKRVRTRTRVRNLARWSAIRKGVTANAVVSHWTKETVAPGGKSFLRAMGRFGEMAGGVAPNIV